MLYADAFKRSIISGAIYHFTPSQADIFYTTRGCLRRSGVVTYCLDAGEGVAGQRLLCLRDQLLLVACTNSRADARREHLLE